MAYKYNKLEQQIHEMRTYIDSKKKKINVVQWLDTNLKPSSSYQEWQNTFIANDAHIKILIEQTVLHTISAMTTFTLENVQKNVSGYIHPVYCFTDKVNVFYLYDTQKQSWRKMTDQEEINLFKKMHSKILYGLCEWHKQNLDKIKQSDAMAITYNKTMSKLMSVNFAGNSTFIGKCKGVLFHELKQETRSVVSCEYEYE
jgi:hypothetical protein